MLAGFIVFSLLLATPLTTASNSPAISSVQLGTVPRGVAVDPADGLVYTLLFLNGTTAVLKASTLTTVALVPTPSPYSVAVDPVTGDAFVSEGQGASISVISRSTLSVTSSINGAGTPYAVAVDENNDLIAAADTGENTLYIANGSAGVVTAHLRMGSTSALAVDSGLGEAFIGNLSATGQGGEVEAVNMTSGSVIKAVTIPISPDHFALDETNHLLIVTSETTSNGENFVVLYDKTLGLLSMAHVGHALGVVTAGPTGDVFTTDLGINRLYELAENGTVLMNSTGDGKSISFTGITAMAFDQNNEKLYVTENEVTSLIVVSLATGSAATALSPLYLLTVTTCVVLIAAILGARHLTAMKPPVRRDARAS